eukprot:6199975-Pleurochrysis_carterae.AAC.2
MHSDASGATATQRHRRASCATSAWLATSSSGRSTRTQRRHARQPFRMSRRRTRALCSQRNHRQLCADMAPNGGEEQI